MEATRHLTSTINGSRGKKRKDKSERGISTIKNLKQNVNYDHIQRYYDTVWAGPRRAKSCLWDSYYRVYPIQNVDGTLLCSHELCL